MDMGTVLAALDESTVGVFAYVMRSGRPNACAVTPYVVDGAATVTSTLALIDKAAAVRRDQRVTLLAGGAHLAGRASVSVDLTPSWFDQHLRAQERAKYPPARSILGVPGHRCLFSWYLGRVVISIDAGVFTAERRRGSLEPGPNGLGEQLRTARALARQAKANRPRLQSWPATTT